MAKWKKGNKGKGSSGDIVDQAKQESMAPPADLNSIKRKIAAMILMQHHAESKKPKKKGSLSSADK